MVDCVIRMEEDVISLVEQLPMVDRCCFCIPIKGGTMAIGVTGILLIFSTYILVVLKHKTHVDTNTGFLIAFLGLFLLITIFFVFGSILLILAIVERKQNLITYYIVIATVYFAVQICLSVLIPITLIVDGYNPPLALIWGTVTMIITLIWTHFMSVVGSFRTSM